VVGISYFAGAMIPLLPVLFGATDALFSLITAGSVIILMSMLLAFLSGMAFGGASPPISSLSPPP